MSPSLTALIQRVPIHCSMALLCVALMSWTPANASPVITTVAGSDTVGFAGDGGPATDGQLNNPFGVASDPAGNVYFADTFNHSIRKVDTAGNLSTIAGNGTAGFFGNGVSASLAQLRFPQSVAVDTDGNIYIADSANHRIRRIATSGDITTIAGTGTPGSTGDGGPAVVARVNRPAGIAWHTSGALYFTEGTSHRVRRIAGGIIATVAGTGIAGYSGDGGPGVNAQVSSPDGIAVDASGRVYVVDTGNGRIRRIDTLGVITTFAGDPAGTLSDGSLATATRFGSARSVAIAGSGVVYVTEFNRVRYIGTDGIVATLAGGEFPGFSGDGGPAGDALFASPYGLTLDAAGSLLVADSQNSRIRKVTDPTPPPTPPLAPVLSTVTPGDGQVSLAFTSGGDGGLPITQYIATCGVESVSGTASPIVVPNLTNGTSYDCSVVAVSPAGTSAASNVLSGWPIGQPVVTLTGPAGSLPGASVTFTATVAGTNLDGGGLNFFEEGNGITGCSGLAMVAGQAQCTTSFATVGERSITAAYSGNAYNAVAYSPGLTHAVTSQSSYLQEVSRSGTGGGTVTSNPAGIDCGTDCSESFAPATVVTLFATPDTHSVFLQWQGTAPCAEGPSSMTCTQSPLASDRQAVAVFDVKMFTISVSQTGAPGLLGMNPGTCFNGASCGGSIASGTMVTLNAAPDQGASFVAWSGVTCNEGPQSLTCTFMVTANASPVATFGYPILFTKTGTGSVTSVPAGISCNETCSFAEATFMPGTSVTLTAVAGANAQFAGWSGSCSGTGSCTVMMDGQRGISATFAAATRTLTVSRSGSGTGSVASISSSAIECPGTCSAQLPHGTIVTLGATPQAGSIFAGWSGGACTGSGTCVVTMDQARSVTATFTATRTLTVTRSGSGSGSVISIGSSAIDCPATCAADLLQGTVVTLSATPQGGSTFAGWSGDGCTGTGNCVVTMDQARAVTATFMPIRTLTVSRAGNGSGSVVSTGSSAIDCPATCSADLPHGTVMTLVATPQGGSTFAGWGGSCTGTGNCVVTMDQARSVTATFTPTRTLTVSRAGSGTGSVASTGSSAINCPATCSADFTHGTEVTLAATAQGGSTFAGWSGACTGSGTCVVMMDQARTVTATFTVTRTLAVSRSGSGSGSVVSISSSAINCPATCSADLPQGTVITLGATPQSGSTFAGWSGGGCAGNGTCVLTMDQALNITATFDPAATQESADLVLLQSATPNPASVSKDVVLTFALTNNGPATATAVVLSHVTPVGATLIWSSPGCIATAGTVTCSASSLASSASVTFRVVVRPTVAGSITSNASATAAQADPSSVNSSSSLTVPVNTTPVGVPATRYRLYSPVTVEHHFTTDLNEYTVLGTYVGTWVQEGTVGKVLNNPGSFGGMPAAPYYRLYDNGTRWHHWTTDANEYYTLGYVYSGWNMEGVDGYILPSQAPGTIQLYRLNYPALGALHHWTVDANEYNTLITPAYGWIGEGGSGYVIP